jgi:deaminated glutathione amidase
VSCELSGITVGASICFDIRFPHLFQALVQRGSELICIPSNFTYLTGKAHWETLVRARAIETQCFVIAANLCGNDRSIGVRSFGHSMIVDPWGCVMARAANEETLLTAVIDREEVRAVRQRIPLRSPLCPNLT